MIFLFAPLLALPTTVILLVMLHFFEKKKFGKWSTFLIITIVTLIFLFQRGLFQGGFLNLLSGPFKGVACSIRYTYLGYNSYLFLILAVSAYYFVLAIISSVTKSKKLIILLHLLIFTLGFFLTYEACT